MPPQTEAKPKEPLKQSASWNLREIKDTPANVIEAIQQAAFVPDACKAMLIEAINQTHGKSRLIRLDVHCQIAKTAKGIKNIGTWDISEL